MSRLKYQCLCWGCYCRSNQPLLSITEILDAILTRRIYNQVSYYYRCHVWLKTTDSQQPPINRSVSRLKYQCLCWWCYCRSNQPLLSITEILDAILTRRIYNQVSYYYRCHVWLKTTDSQQPPINRSVSRLKYQCLCWWCYCRSNQPLLSITEILDAILTRRIYNQVSYYYRCHVWLKTTDSQQPPINRSVSRLKYQCLCWWCYCRSNQPLLSITEILDAILTRRIYNQVSYYYRCHVWLKTTDSQQPPINRSVSRLKYQCLCWWCYCRSNQPLLSITEILDAILTRRIYNQVSYYYRCHVWLKTTDSQQPPINRSVSRLKYQCLYWGCYCRSNQPLLSITEILDAILTRRIYNQVSYYYRCHVWLKTTDSQQPPINRSVSRLKYQCLCWWCYCRSNQPLLSITEILDAILTRRIYNQVSYYYRCHVWLKTTDSQQPPINRSVSRLKYQCLCWWCYCRSNQPLLSITEILDAILTRRIYNQVSYYYRCHVWLKTTDSQQPPINRSVSRLKYQCLCWWCYCRSNQPLLSITEILDAILTRRIYNQVSYYYRCHVWLKTTDSQQPPINRSVSRLKYQCLCWWCYCRSNQPLLSITEILDAILTRRIYNQVSYYYRCHVWLKTTDSQQPPINRSVSRLKYQCLCWWCYCRSNQPLLSITEILDAILTRRIYNQVSYYYRCHVWLKTTDSQQPPINRSVSRLKYQCLCWWCYCRSNQPLLSITEILDAILTRRIYNQASYYYRCHVWLISTVFPLPSVYHFFKDVLPLYLLFYWNFVCVCFWIIANFLLDWTKNT